MMTMELCLLNLHVYNAYVNDAGVAVAPPKWKCDCGPGLGNVLDICGTPKWGETVLEFPPFFQDRLGKLVRFLTGFCVGEVIRWKV